MINNLLTNWREAKLSILLILPGFLVFLALAWIPGNLQARIHPFIGLGAGQWSGNDEMVKAPFYMAEIGLEKGLFGVSFAGGQYNQYNPPKTLYEGNLELIPLLFSGYVRLPITKRLRFRGGGGFGYILAKHELADKIIQAQEQFASETRDELKSGMSSHALGGLEYSITRNWSIGIDVIYIFFRTTDRVSTKFWYKNRLTDISSENEVDLSGAIGMAQIKYRW